TEDLACLEELPSCYGTPYRIFRVPMPGTMASGDLRTYTNSLIVNNHVIVPLYGHVFDEAALDTYRDAMPGYRVVGVDCSQLIMGRGALHCITREVARSRVVLVGHARFRGPAPVGKPVEFRAQCWCFEAVEDVVLHVAEPGVQEFKTRPMSLDGSEYRVRMTPSKAGEVKYFISARTSSGLVGHKPQNAWDGGWLSLEVSEE
ncbi:MAG TPA: hypothetical protein ENN80_08635, partial [Candidatus Hydrogenedentes bacterium]|nr:hypothetical protein [Candidatus Hydrogenedentota bacterium]